jgi:hypothetical protein
VVTEETFDTVGLLFADEDAAEKRQPLGGYEFQVPDESQTERVKTFVTQDSEEESREETPEEENLAETLLAGEAVKARRRLSNWAYLMLLGLFVVGGTILFKISRGDEPRVPPPRSGQPAVVKPADPVTVTDQTADQATEEISPRPVEPPVIAAALPQASTTSPSPDPAKPVQEEKTQPAPTAEVQPPVDPWQLIRAGRYEDAGQVWAEQMRRQEVKFSILLELDCQIESVQHAIGQFADTRDLFLLNRRRGERACYLVMWGRFQDEASANSAYSSIPAYFTRQEHPPKVIALAPYL